MFLVLSVTSDMLFVVGVGGRTKPGSMLRVSVPRTVDLPLEYLFTNSAGERFVAAIFPH